MFETGGEGWSWVQNETDGYVGYLPSEALGPIDPQPTHRITALRTFLYPGPDLKLPPIAAFSIGSLLPLGGGGGDARHAVPAACRRRRRDRRPACGADRRGARKRFRRRRRTLRRNALSLGRTDQPRPRLLGARPALADDDRSVGNARYRPAGAEHRHAAAGRSRRRAPPRRPRLLARPCRDRRGSRDAWCMRADTT